MRVPLDVPELLRQRAMANGGAGRRWLDALPEVVTALADGWGLEIGDAFRGGTAAYVAVATDCGLPTGAEKAAWLTDSMATHGATTGWPSSRSRPAASERKLTGLMFVVDEFVAECQAALRESQPVLAVKEVLDRAVAEPAAVATALRAEPGVTLLHRSDDLTVLSVVIPAGVPQTLPHDHRMWALVGIYGGQEDNQFFRRADGGLTQSGGRSMRVSETLAMGDDTVHAIRNPLGHEALAAIHVYGGDLISAERSMWTRPGYDEQPYDDTKVLGRGGIRYADS